MSSELKDAVAKALTSATKDFVRVKRRAAAAANSDYLTTKQVQKLRRRQERDDVIKPAVYEVMAEAYNLASADGTLPANARQIMYQARPRVLAATNGKCWKDSNYFTQTLLPDYMSEHPDETRRWDVVFDARGHLAEPHVRTQLGLGTVDVRNYVQSWQAGNSSNDIEIDIEELYPTRGPTNRYKFALFIEKEGFDALLDRSQIARKYDLAIFSSKGQSTTATRQLVDALSQAGVTILVVHDFDTYGLAIAHNLGHDTRRYQFEVQPSLIDLGLRLGDVAEMQLQSEPVEFDQIKDPGEKLFDYDDVTQEEIDFLVEGRLHYKRWYGKRVELNAMTSDRFVTWLEGKLHQHGVQKVISDKKTLKDAWRRAQMLAKIKAEVAEIKTQPLDTEPMPAGIDKRLRKLLHREPELSWDEGLLRIAWEGARSRFKN